MRCQLLHRERGLADSAGQTVRMVCGAASRASFVAFRLTQNKPPLQIRHRAALTITTAITFDPVLAGFGLARHDGTASVTAAKRNSVNGNRDSLRENRPGINTCQADGPVFADIDIGTAFDEPDRFVGSDGNFVADQLADGLEELGQVFAAGREACLFDDMQKLPLALLNGSRGYGRAKDAEFRVAVDIVGFFALGFLPDGGRVFHAYSSYPMMSTVWAGA